MPPTDSQPTKRIDPTNPWVIASGTIGCGIILLAAPPLLFLLPIAVPILVVMYFISAGSTKKARSLARKHLGAGVTSGLEAEFSPGMSGALVMNDWGIVYVTLKRRPVELAWSDVRLVDEPDIAMLAFHTHDAVAFEADLSQDRYFKAIWAIHSKIPDRTRFDVDAVTGESNLLRKLQHAPLSWQGKWGSFVVTVEGVERDGNFMPWHDIGSVQETSYLGDETESYWELAITSASKSFSLKSTDFSDGRQIGNSGYDTIKAILALRVAGKVVFDRRAALPKNRAIDEFNRGRDAAQVALQLTLKSGKTAYLENHFGHMLALVDSLSLEGSVDTASFFRDYAELLKRAGRREEARKLEDRSIVTKFYYEPES